MVFAETRIATYKRNINQFLGVCVYFKDFANGINYIQARKMNNNQLAFEAAMYFECQIHLGMWAKFSCITMSLFIVILYTFSCNVNKRLSFNTISLNIFDRVPVVLLYKSGLDALA